MHLVLGLGLGDLGLLFEILPFLLSLDSLALDLHLLDVRLVLFNLGHLLLLPRNLLKQIFPL